MLITVLLAILTFFSCTKKNNCKDCQIETYQNGQLLEKDGWVEYCDEKLQEVNGQTTAVGDMTTKMVCR